MDDWLDQLATKLGIEPLGRDEMGRLLRATREVAHRVERKDAPLAAFLLGVAAARHGEVREGLADALSRLEGVLPPEHAREGTRTGRPEE